jgi:hypothetical protein
VFRLPLQILNDLAQHADALQGLLAENLFLLQHIRLRETLARFGQHKVAFLRIGQIEQICRVNQREQVIDFQLQIAQKQFELAFTPELTSSGQTIWDLQI